jgi:thiamine pyrophosphate-dependent acetolactate synthase large subunit-like protein
MEATMLSRKRAINNIFDKHGPNAVYVTNTGYISRAVYQEHPQNKNIFYMQGSMGLAPCIGLGIALNTDKEVVILSGDAALLMHLGILHTIRDQNLSNLYVYVLDNGCHESVGGYKCAAVVPLPNVVNEEDICEWQRPVSTIVKISNDGKCRRVELDCIENTKNLKSLL